MKIDETDRELARLFSQRMGYSQEVAQIKQKGNLPVQDDEREQQIVDQALEQSPTDLKGETALLMRTIMAMSRGYQQRLIFGGEVPMLPQPKAPQKENIVCAYQGVPGAWSEQAVEALFPGQEKLMCGHFEDVFLAVKENRAYYGVVPVENSKTGAIGETYDLLRKYGCYIVGRIQIAIRQCLVGLPGTKLGDIREVLSHPEGFSQCSRFLQHKNWEQTACRNTAVAAQKVAEGQNPKVAAIASRRAAQLNGLEVLAPDIMDSADNRTSFVVIALEPEYDASSRMISVTFSTQHRSGALCETLLPFMGGELNLMRIESRPAAGGKYRFFADIDGNILDERVQVTLRQASASSEYFELLGCYSETKED